MRNTSKPYDELKPNESDPAPCPESRVERLEDRGSRYQRRGPLGRGAMGTVDAVWDPSLRRTLAMKRLRDDVTDPNATTRFLEEAQITGQLEHPGVVPLHELARDAEGRPFFTMRRIRGRSLKDLLKRVEDPEDEEWTRGRILTSLLRVCETMAYAHTKGVVHRDIKPSNIMVGRFGETYVVDWGLGRLMDQPDQRDLRIAPEVPSEQTASLHTDGRDQREDSDAPIYTMDGDVVGTPAYMSPEQAYGDLQQIGPHSDVYSIGATLYHLLAGHAPYVEPGRRMSGRVVLARLLEGPPARLDAKNRGIAPELVSICERCMARKPRDRYDDCNELAEDLRAFLEGRVVQAHKTGAWVELRKWATRNRIATSALGVMGLALALTLAGLVRNQVLRRQEAESSLRELTAEQSRRSAVQDYLSLAQLSIQSDRLGYGSAMKTHRDRWQRRVEQFLARWDTEDSNGWEGGLEPEEHQELLTYIPYFKDEIAFHQSILELEEQNRALADAPALSWPEVRSGLEEDLRFSNVDYSKLADFVPLRFHPDTGYAEFYLPVTGTPPLSSDDGSHWRIEEDTGMVFALLPGGEFISGTEVEDPGESFNEQQHEISVDPLLASVFEVTQGQFSRLMRRNPSYAQSPRMRFEILYNLRHPVESVSRSEAELYCSKIGARLPDEYEWEYFARAGSEQIYPWGDDWLSASRLENLGDLETFELLEDKALPREYYVPWSDGYPEHAPVGSFGANPFGLHDVLGNVGEWTSDYGPLRAENSLPTVRPGRGIVRGGNWMRGMHDARPALRQTVPVGNTNQLIGFRPVMSAR